MWHVMREMIEIRKLNGDKSIPVNIYRSKDNKLINNAWEWEKCMTAVIYTQI